MRFEEFVKKMQTHFNEMCKNVTRLYVTDTDPDEMYNLYLDSYPAGTNDIYRVRREYDCGCCRHFIKNMGNVVAIKDGKVHTIWDIPELDDLPCIENPLWKPFLIFFWPIAIVLLGVFSFKKYIEEIIEYYKEKKNKEN